MILSICDMPDALKVLRIVNIVIQIIRIVVPIILIISAMIDLVRAVTNAELNKITKPMVAKVAAAILIFMIPVFVRVVAIIAGNDREYEQCLKDISKETIELAYQNVAEALVKQAEESLEESDVNSAEYYLINIKDEGLKAAFQERLNKVREKIEEAKKPKYAEPIKPDSSERIWKQEETDTLKIYITDHNTYYITRAWMVDPYNQINKQDANPYGKTLKHPSEILKTAISENHLENKLVVGMNASGFYLKNVYDAASVSRYPAYDKTSVGTLVITNGQVVRNAYTKAFKTWFIYGIDKNGNLQIFRDLKASTQAEINEKKEWADSVINSGIRNTFTFASPLIENGEASNETTSMPAASYGSPKRQAFCQIDSNNYAFIVGKAQSRQDLINIMRGLNCHTGVNLDGGGSIALLYKGASSDKIQTVIGNGRQLTEVLYLTEK